MNLRNMSVSSGRRATGGVYIISVLRVTPVRRHYASPSWSPRIVLLIYAKVGPLVVRTFATLHPFRPFSFYFYFSSHSALNYVTKSFELIELLLKSRRSLYEKKEGKRVKKTRFFLLAPPFSFFLLSS